MTAPPQRSSSRALVVSVILGLFALGGGASALLLPDRGVMVALAISACVAFASMIAALVSFGGRRAGASLGALAASLVILAGIGAGFGAVSVRRFLDGVEQQRNHVEPHVYEEPGFRLTPPYRDVVVYSPRALRDVNERAAAGMWLPDENMTVLVFVELPYERALEVAAREELRVALPEEPLETHVRSVRFLERDAVRVQRTFARDEGTLHEESTFFLDRGHVYGVVARQIVETPPGDPWFTEPLAAFALLDGEVRLSFVSPRIATDDGPGWRVRDAVYESGDFGVRVRGEHLRLRYGDAALGAHGRAILVLDDRHPDRVLLVAATLTGGRDPAAVAAELRAQLDAWTAPDPAPHLVREIAGQRVQLEARVASPNRTWRYRYGIWSDAERVFELFAWAPTRALADEATAELARVTILGAEETASLRAQLARRNDPWHGVGETWTIRDGALTDWDEGVRWWRPGAWSARASDAREEDGSEEILVFSAPSLGLMGRVIAYEATASALEHHSQIVDDYAALYAATPPPEQAAGAPHRFGEADGLVTARLSGPEHAYALGTVVRDEDVYHVEVWGTLRDFDAQPDAVRAAVEGFEVIAREPMTRFVDGEHRDLRMGYALRSPWGAPPGTEWSALDGGVGALAHFDGGDDSIAIVTARRDPGVTAEDQAAFLLNDYYADVAYFAAGWSDTDATLAGRQCRVRERRLPLGTGTVRVYRVTDRGILYVLVVNDRGHVDLERAAEGFRLLSP